ncbi:hypothetical protein LCGC14_3146340 [marine sediment metagenome]|uniref:C2H2-type domain-containing protein n=1 Tax=marine sediment metagenome TaxID=412755 RepID=A0A0F8YJN1_9ZZZZ
MLYIALRDCFVYDVFRRKGETYELPDGVEINPKNFELAEKQVAVEEKPAAKPKPAPAATSREVAPDAPKNPRELNPGESLCGECGRMCKSSFGLQSHMKVHQPK